MTNFPELVALSTVMGLSIYLSMPVILRKKMGSRTITLLNAAAIGILAFLLADIFADAAPTIYSGTSNAFVANGSYAIAFALAVTGCYLVLFASEHRSRGTKATPVSLALIVALAIGFQNLTEGLVFGASWALGTVGLSTVVFVGFFLQNVTEGFPITAPLLSQSDRRVGLIAMFFLIGGLPTVVGGVAGYFYNSALFNLVFQALAIGAILYSVLPMLRTAFRPADPPDATYIKQRLVYLGVLVGFLVGFLVNAI
jgi:zinc transporter, ZIP family